MAAPLSQPQREDLRYAVREQLVAAATVALNADMILRRVARARVVDFPIEPTDIAAALSFLVSLGQISSAPDELGSTPYYQATAQGILAHERGR